MEDRKALGDDFYSTKGDSTKQGLSEEITETIIRYLNNKENI